MIGEDQARDRLFSRRTMILAGLQGAGFVLLAGRLYQLQVLERDTYHNLAEDNRINLELLPPERGLVLDRNGVPLADNGRSLRVVMVPEQTNGVHNTLGRLAQLVELSPDDVRRVLKEVERNRPFSPVEVLSGLDWQTFARINANSSDLPGVQAQQGSVRVYPGGASTSHIVGYVGPANEQDRARDEDPLLGLSDFRIGKRGVERVQDTRLRGRAGNRQVEVNAYGRIITELDRAEGQQGDDIHLTLDQRLQVEAMGLMEGESGAVIVMDVENGGLLALASTPGFDPNAFTRGISHADWDELSQNEKAPLVNKPLHGRYPPGSTFKMVVLAAAFEAGVIDEHKRHYCPGYLDHGDHRFHCWAAGGHGHVDYLKAMRSSCDVYFYQVARELGIDRIADMGRRMGLQQSYDLASGRSHAGTVPTKAWKMAEIGKPWQVGETFIAGIGQGFVLTTPLELAVMTARIANGKKAVTPKLLLEKTHPANPPAPGEEETTDAALEIKPWVLNYVREAMDQVVNHPAGTAFSSRLKYQGATMAGKTGTAQVRRISRSERQSRVLRNEELPWKQRDHALFVGYAPAHKPRYAAAIVVEHGGSGSHAAAPKVRDVLHAALRLNAGARPTNTRKGKA